MKYIYWTLSIRAILLRSLSVVHAVLVRHISPLPSKPWFFSIPTELLFGVIICPHSCTSCVILNSFSQTSPQHDFAELFLPLLLSFVMQQPFPVFVVTIAVCIWSCCVFSRSLSRILPSSAPAVYISALVASWMELQNCNKLLARSCQTLVTYGATAISIYSLLAPSCHTSSMLLLLSSSILVLNLDGVDVVLSKNSSFKGNSVISQLMTLLYILISLLVTSVMSLLIAFDYARFTLIANALVSWPFHWLAQTGVCI